MTKKLLCVGLATIAGAAAVLQWGTGVGLALTAALLCLCVATVED